MNIAHMILSEVCDLDFTNFKTGAYLGQANELQELKISNSQDDSYAVGKNEAKIGTFSKNKAVKLSGSSGQFEDFILGLQTGSGVIVGDTAYEYSEILTVSATNTVTIKYKADAVKRVAVIDTNGHVSSNLTQDATASVGKYSFTTATGVVTFNTDVTQGTLVKVFYDTTAKDAMKISNDAQTFSGLVGITGNTIVVDGCDDSEYLAQLVIPKAKISGTFDIDLKGEPAVQDFEIEALTGCGNNKLWDLIIADGTTSFTVNA